MVFGSIAVNGAAAASSWYWHEVETEHGVVKPHVPHKTATMNDNVHMVAGGTKVKFAIVTSTLQSVPWPEAEDLPPASPINNMCSELLRAEVPVNQKPRKLTGCISDETHRHNFYVVRSFVGDPRSESLETLLASSSSPIRFQTRSGFVFNRRDRLWLAANLACSVLQLHGSWLKARWQRKTFCSRRLNPRIKRNSTILIYYSQSRAVQTSPSSQPIAA
ncbi:hypothetical protein VTN96DRAFT_3083 [Rasamsonia emersonii]